VSGKALPGGFQVTARGDGQHRPVTPRDFKGWSGLQRRPYHAKLRDVFAPSNLCGAGYEQTSPDVNSLLEIKAVFLRARIRERGNSAFSRSPFNRRVMLQRRLPRCSGAS